MKTKLYPWLSANKDILFNGGSLLGTMVINSGLGFIYWWLAARLFSQSAVGLASAAVSAMMLLGTIGMVGLGTLLIGELPRQPGKAASLIATALVIAGTISGLLAVLFAVAAPVLSSELAPLADNVFSVLIFAMGVVLTGMTLVLDQALIGLLRGGVQLWRNTLFAASKLAALFAVGLWIASEAGITIYATWLLGNLLSLGLVAVMAIKQGVRLPAFKPQWELVRGRQITALKHHMLNLSLQAPAFTLPIMVTALMSAEVNASFYVSWMLCSFLFVVPAALGTVLYAVGAANASLLAEKIRLTLRLSLLAVALGAGALIIGAKVFLQLFGPEYVDQATTSLRILALATFPGIIKSHYVAIRQIHGEITTAARLMGAGAALELVGAAVGGSLGGLTGLCLGWLLVICLEAVVTAPLVYRIASTPSRRSDLDSARAVSV